MEMKGRLQWLLVLSLLLAAGPLTAQPGSRETLLKQAPNDVSKVTNGPLGREFWIAIPPNEVTGYGWTRALEVYVSSPYDTEVTLSVPGMGIGAIRKPVRAGEITAFSDNPTVGGMAWAYEVRKSGSVTSKGIHITAEHPISVCVLTSRSHTSEGYMALPVRSWDTEYMHLGYYDFKDGGGERGGGFIVIAQEDATQIDITLSGTGESGLTADGHPLGYRYRKLLMKGQTFMVHGNGQGVKFDLSGTRIMADKPVGVVSFHMRTIIPNAAAFNSRDNLVEMMSPLSCWGTQYVAVELNRMDRGDYFRIIAADDNTTFRVRYYDTDSRALIGEKSGVIKNAGQWREYEETPLNPEISSIRGVSVWTADKPVLVAQYAYSAAWDNAKDFDPFKIFLTSTEQFVHGGTTFQTPTGAEFTTNWFTVIAEGDTNDPAQRKLRTLELDGQKIHDRDQTFLVNNIPGTNLYWARINVQPGAHTLRGETRIGGSIYGFSTWDTYGWPVGTGLNTINVSDTLAPEIVQSGSCGKFSFAVTELRNGDPRDTHRQVDAGIAAVELIESLSSNYQLQRNAFPAAGRFYTSEFRLTPIDTSREAKAVFTVLDRADNLIVDSVLYAPELLSASEDELIFDNTRVGLSESRSVTLNNPGQSPIVINNLRLRDGLVFAIVDAPALPLTLGPGETLQITLRFSPNRETSDINDPDAVDTDILEFTGACFRQRIATVTGRGVLPRIHVEDWNFGSRAVGREYCIDEGLLLRNYGSEALTIDGISGISAPFFLSDPVDPPLPIVIQPDEHVRLRTLCFRPDMPGEFEQELTFHSDAPPGDDNIARLSAVASGPVSVSERDAGRLHIEAIRPNPASDAAMLALRLPAALPVDILVHDRLGRRLYANNAGTFDAGSHSIPLALEQFSSGLYYLTVSAGSLRETVRLTVLR